MKPGDRSLLRADVLRGRRPAALSNTNMTQTLSPKGQLMAARDNPTTSTRKMVGGPPPQDRDDPAGANAPPLGHSQPNGSQGRDEFPLRHARQLPKRNGR